MSTEFDDDGGQHFGVLGSTGSTPTNPVSSFGVIGALIASASDLQRMKLELVSSGSIPQPIWASDVERGGGRGTTVPKAGVLGISTSGADTAGVVGENDETGGVGVVGASLLGTGVSGRSTGGRGVWGFSESFIATVGDSSTGTGIWGHSISGTGVYGEGTPAGRFKGNVNVTGDVHVGDVHVVKNVDNTGGNVYARDVIVAGGDCAEEFDVSDVHEISPGTVMVLDSDGDLQPSYRAYDRRVAGVVSGAGDFKPGIILDRQPRGGKSRVPLGLVGKVYCKVDARYSAVAAGDLLTTSPTPGHAMKVHDILRAVGAIIGKALRPVAEGQALIPILISLQ